MGKNLLLKFLPGDSIFFHEKLLQDLIKTPDLLSSQMLSDLIKEKELSENISKKLSESIEFQETIKTIPEEESFQNSIKNYLKTIKQKIIDDGQSVREIEKITNFYLAKNYPLYFCENCNGYLANSTEFLPESCKFCGNKTNENKQINIKYLDEKIISYLNGYWLEDYIAKILKSLNWQTWTHGSIMGSSGVAHPIDIVAINKKGQTLVAECKSGAFGGKDIFNFVAQCGNIKGTYGFFFALKENFDTNGKDYMDRTPGLKFLDKLKNVSDLNISNEIENFIK